jgi:UDP-glucose 4-epimerase
VEAVTGRTVPAVEAPRRAGDPPVLVADPQRAEAVLSWRARFDLAAMVEDAWRWHRQLAGRTRDRQVLSAAKASVR